MRKFLALCIFASSLTFSTAALAQTEVRPLPPLPPVRLTPTQQRIKIILESSYLRFMDIEKCLPRILAEHARVTQTQNTEVLTEAETRDRARRRSECIDRYTHFVSPLGTRQIKEKIEGRFVGAGIVITPNENGKIEITRVMPDNPADRAGLRKGDLIFAVKQKRSDKWTIVRDTPHAVLLFRGREGTTFFALIKRGDVGLIVPITRARINIETVFSEVVELDIGYIRVTSFTKRTPDEFSDALKALLRSGIRKKLIIDLRNNPGGELYSGLEVLFYFSSDPADHMMSVRERHQNTRFTIGSLTGSFIDPRTGTRKTPGQFKDFNVIVLVNKQSASASEIVAGTLDDWGNAHGRFRIVGETTFGKGVGQSIAVLRDGSTFLFTSFEFFVGNSATPIQGRGVVPDVRVEDSRRKPTDTGTSHDAQFIKALQLLEMLP